MDPQPDRIILASEQPLRILPLRQLLRDSGLTAELAILSPEALGWNPAPDEFCLVVLEGDLHGTWDIVVQARRRARNSRFVWLPAEITPQSIHAALEAGLHGVLATNLPFAETSEALARICRGEVQFRFGGEQTPKNRASQPPPGTQPVRTISGGKEAAAGFLSW